VEGSCVVDPEVGARGRRRAVDAVDLGEVDLYPVATGVAVVVGTVVGLHHEAEALVVGERPG